MTRKPVDRAFVTYFVRLALGSAAAFVTLLALTALVIVLLEPEGWVALIVVALGLALAIGAMALVSRTLTRRYQGDPRSEGK